MSIYRLATNESGGGRKGDKGGRSVERRITACESAHVCAQRERVCAARGDVRGRGEEKKRRATAFYVQRVNDVCALRRAYKQVFAFSYARLCITCLLLCILRLLCLLVLHCVVYDSMPARRAANAGAAGGRASQLLSIFQIEAKVGVHFLGRLALLLGWENKAEETLRRMVGTGVRRHSDSVAAVVPRTPISVCAMSLRSLYLWSWSMCVSSSSAS